MVTVLLLIAFLSSAAVAGHPVYAGSVSTEQPVLVIEFYYSNPCTSCPTVSDFEELVREAGLDWSDKVAIQVVPCYAYTTDGIRKIKVLLDEHLVPQEERYYGDVVLVGSRLLLRDIESELPVALAEEAAALLAKTATPTPPVEAEPSLRPTGPVPSSTELIFFSSKSCVNCRKAETLLAEIEVKTDLSVIRYDIVQDADRFRAIIDRYRIKAPAVPLIIYREDVWIGYNPVIVQEIRAAAGLATEQDDRQLFIWDLDEVPLVFSTVIIGLTDGFNPCSLWALLFLISMIIRLQSRKTMLMVGLTYILIVSLVYGLFILGLFGVISSLIAIDWLRYPLFVLTFLFGAANVYSFFSQKDPLVSISEEHKKRFVRQIRTRLYAQTRLPGLIVATVLIALLASLIELPCTAGFPVIWNAILAGQKAGPAIYLPLLGLYLLMYSLDELLVVLLMTFTMKKLYVSQTVGRSLKLISGLLMVYLAFMLLLGADYLSSTVWVVGGSVAVIVAAAALALILKNRRAR